jgi:hypothetical protein
MSAATPRSILRPARAGAAAALAMLVALVGCGDDGDHPAATPTRTAATTPVATVSPTAPDATGTATIGVPTATLAPATATGTSPPATETPAPTALPTVQGGPLAMRRLTTSQYKATIADVLGADIEVAGRIEPDNRRDGLLAVGASFVSVTGAGFEQYETAARHIAEQALDPAHRGAVVPCTPSDAAAPDDACADAFIRQVGARLLRRPVDDADVAPRVALARESAVALGDFYAGLQPVLTSLLLAPEFLFRVEVAEADPQAPQRQRLTDASMATRLSYFLWNTTPDAELAEAAQRGELVDDAGLERAVDRLLESPRLVEAVRAFFSDLYGFDEIEDGLVRKDPTLFPAFSQALITDAREQTLRVIAHHLLDEDGDYRQLFTTRESFMTRALGIVYQVPVRTVGGWEPYTFPAGSPRAGLLTHISILALRSHPGRSSPTLRGKFVREVLLCTDVPPPPGDVDFSMFGDPSGPNRRTARERLQQHVENEVCAGCHGMMDPIGLGLEQLDGIGEYRDTENGATTRRGAARRRRFRRRRRLGDVLARDLQLAPVCRQPSVRRRTRHRACERVCLVPSRRAEAEGYRLRDSAHAPSAGVPPPPARAPIRRPPPRRCGAPAIPRRPRARSPTPLPVTPARRGPRRRSATRR